MSHQDNLCHINMVYEIRNVNKHVYIFSLTVVAVRLNNINVRPVTNAVA